MECSNVRARNLATSNSQAQGLWLLVPVLALGLLFASVASPQILETTIVLPDTLGPLNGPYHLACTDDTAFPRLYIGGEGDSGGVIVADAITCKRLARIATGPVKTLCYVALHNKLYVACLGADSVKVVDCASNQVVSTVHVAGEVPVMLYNSQNGRLYCGGTSVSVIDCAADTMVRTIPVPATVFALDSAQNKLFVGDTLSPSAQPLAVVDCAGDSVVATIAGLAEVGALCFHRTARKLYATSGDTLYVVDTARDSITARLFFESLQPLLACNSESSRVYCVYDRYPHLAIVDGTGDTVLSRLWWGGRPYGMACNVTRNLLYRMEAGRVFMLDGTTGQVLTSIHTQSRGGNIWVPRLSSLFCPPEPEDPPSISQKPLLVTIDGMADSVAGIVPLTMMANQVTLDTVRNRLYFVYQTVGTGCVGTVDCSRNIVTDYRYAGDWTTAICYNPNNDRLYWSTYDEGTALGAIVVYDCAARSVVKQMPIDGETYKVMLHVGLNKLFVYAGSSVSIIDCNRDTLINSVFLAGNYPRPVLLVPEDNRFWYLGVYDVVVVDCVGDTEVARVADSLGSLDDACACPKDRKIYTSLRQVIDMDNPAHVETTKARGNRFLYDQRTSRLYVNGNDSSRAVIRVFDVTADTEIGSRFYGPCMITGMCLGPTGNFIYCAGYGESLAFVIDVHRNQVVATFPVPTWGAARDPLAANRSTNRIYEAQYDTRSFPGIPVFHDSTVIGIEETPSAEARTLTSPTVVRGALFLERAPNHKPQAASLIDIAGRNVMSLKVGANDVRALSPGIYFVRAPSPTGGQWSAITKVVIAR